mgnify:CR=1 FL=1
MKTSLINEKTDENKTQSDDDFQEFGRVKSGNILRNEWDVGKDSEK